MHRRTFLKAAAVAGLSVVSPFSLKEAEAQSANGLYNGPVFFFIHCDGGWDPTSVYDPKGSANNMNRYDTAAIEMAGNIPYAPVANHAAFFQKHYEKTLIVNGIDQSTNGHEQGERYTWSGKLNEGHPALAAVLAATAGPALPMSFISNGGYDMTMGIVAATRADRVDTIPRIAFANKINVGNEATFHSDFAYQKIQAAADLRLEDSMNRVKLPRLRNAMSALQTSRLGEAELKEVLAYLPDNLNDNNELVRQSRVALAAFKAGLGVSVSMRIGGFDTHGDHDNRHIPRLSMVLEGVDFIFDEAERMGIADRVFVMVGSEFGRTPGYNGGNGKDHWPVNSMMLFGNGVPGNKVIGGTDERHGLKMVDPATLQVVDSGGMRIKPEHVHAAIRKFAKIERSPIAFQFGLDGEDIGILG
jgi:uncharacterized protein (DUF1501 family)